MCAYAKEKLINRILIEIKERITIKEGNLWTVNNYNIFIANLTKEERIVFPEIMNELCQKGFFKALKRENAFGFLDYRLTAKGVELINGIK